MADDDIDLDALLASAAAALGVSITEEDDPLGREVDPSKLMAAGWVYRDMPWTTIEAWDEAMAAIGPENVIVLARSERPGSRRGQVLISPEGMRRVMAKAAN